MGSGSASVSEGASPIHALMLHRAGQYEVGHLDGFHAHSVNPRTHPAQASDVPLDGAHAAIQQLTCRARQATQAGTITMSEETQSVQVNLAPS